METPSCQCGSTTGWVIRRELKERQCWNPELNRLENRDIECVELDVLF